MSTKYFLRFHLLLFIRKGVNSAWLPGHEGLGKYAELEKEPTSPPCLETSQVMQRHLNYLERLALPFFPRYLTFHKLDGKQPKHPKS